MKALRNLGIFRAAVALFLLILVAVSFANSLGAAALAATQKEKKIKLTVIVKDVEGKLVSRASVNVWHDTWGPDVGDYDYKAETGADGVATIEVTSGKVTGEGWAFSPQVYIEVVKGDLRERVLVKLASAQVTQSLVLKPRDSATGFLIFYVKVHVERENGQPVGGAVVKIQEGDGSPRTHAGITGPDGSVIVPVTLLASKYFIEASKEGYSQASGKTQIRVSNDQAGKTVDSPTIKLTRNRGAEVTVSVKNAKDQSPLTGAKVVLNGKAGITSGVYYGTTDGSGRATIFTREYGKFAVEISQEHFESYSGEVRLSDGDEQGAFEFTLTEKPRKEVRGNPVEVTVLAGDKNNAPIEGALVRVGKDNAATKPDGKATVDTSLGEESYVAVTASAIGYQSATKTVPILRGVIYTNASASATFVMQPDSEGVIEVSVLTAAKNGGSSLPLAGAMVKAGEATMTTNASGLAKLTGKFEGSVEVVVEKSGYLRQSRNVNASAGKPSMSFTLLPEPDEDSVSITVMALAPKGGSPSPIVGAEVSANGLIATTNNSGQATITGDFKDGVTVSAQAKGFDSQTQQVSITQPARTGSANFLLLPEQPPLGLIVEVRDAATPNNPVENASVYVRRLGTRVGSDLLAVKETNKQGEARIELKGNAEELSQMRSGLTLHVVDGSEKYQQTLSDISAEQLLPSTEARRVIVFLKPSWNALRKAIDELEPRVLAWNNDIAAAVEARDLARKLAEQAQQAKEKVAAMLREIEYAGKAAAGANGVSAIGLQCREAASLKANIQSYKAEAAAKDQALKASLNNASALAGTCSSVKDGEAVKRMYREAIQLTGAIGAIEKKAVKDGNELKKLANENNDLKKIIAEVEKKVAEITQEMSKAEQAAKTVGIAFVRSESLTKSLPGRRDALTGELARLKAAHGLDKYVEVLPPDLDRRVGAMTQLLGRQNNNVFGGPSLDWPKTVQEVARELQLDKVEAVKYLALYKSGADGNCDVEAMDGVVQEIGTMVTNSSFELGLAADLPNKAQACINKGKCLPIINDARALFERYSIEEAAARINEARTQGCDVSGLDEELDYWKTLRDAVVYLKVRQQRCEFREAYEWALNLPPSIQKRPLMTETLASVYNGLKAQERIGSLRRSAKDEVAKTNRVTAAEPFIRQAEQLAAGFPCLVQEVGKFRSDYPATNRADQGPTDEIPGALSENKGKNQNPTDEIPTALGGLTGTLGSSRPPFRPPGEKKPGSKTDQMPTDEVPTALGGSTSKTKPGSKGTQTPTDEVPGALGSNAGRSPLKDDSDKQPGPDKEDPTVKTGGVPDVRNDTLSRAQAKLEAVGLRIGGITRGATPPSPDMAGRIYFQTPAAGSKLPANKMVALKQYGSMSETSAVADGSTGGGTGEQAVDLAGTWVATEKDDRGTSYQIQMTLEPAGTNRWKGSATDNYQKFDDLATLLRKEMPTSFTIVITGTGTLRLTTPPVQGRSGQLDGIFTSSQITVADIKFTRQ